MFGLLQDGSDGISSPLTTSSNQQLYKVSCSGSSETTPSPRAIILHISLPQSHVCQQTKSPSGKTEILPLVGLLFSASALTPFNLQSTALESLFADLIMYC